jgi:hypothetical protein
MEKVIRDGFVAVIISPGYGAGWSTWNQEYPDILFDSQVISWIENGKNPHEAVDLESYLDKTYPEGYFSIEQLEVRWVPAGIQFRIHEYDGNESLVFQDQETWITA